MLHFLSALFSEPKEREGGLDPGLVDKAIERAVDGTDRRLRALDGYQKRLREPVEQAGRHVIALVDALPAPAEISPRAFGADPALRALFVSAEHLREVCGGFNSLRDYLAKLEGPEPAEVFGLLLAVREERSVFGMELEGDSLRRDVLQTAVNFSSHRYLGPAASEDAARWELKKRAFDFLIERALERLMGERGRRLELDRQRGLLQRKLAAMRAGHFGLDMDVDGDGEVGPSDLAALEKEVEAIEAELGEIRADNLSLEESLACVADTLSQPADWLAARTLSLRLDYRGVKVQDPAAGEEASLVELYSGTGASRAALFGRISPADLPAPADFWQAAKRYL